MPSNFNNTTPAAPTGNTNVTWQSDGSGNVSAYVAKPSAPAITTMGNTTFISWNSASGFSKIYGPDTFTALGSNFSSNSSSTTNAANTQYQNATANHPAGLYATGSNPGQALYHAGGPLMQLGATLALSRTTDMLSYTGFFTNSSVGGTFAGTSLTSSNIGAYFRYDTTLSDVNFKCVTCDASALNVIDSGIVADTKSHIFAVQVTGANCTFYIDGVLVATSTTHLPTGVLGWQASVSWASTANLFTFSQLTVMG